MPLDETPPNGGWLVPLSPREREVALLASRGLANKDIARELDLTVGTVKLHVHSIFCRPPRMLIEDDAPIRTVNEFCEQLLRRQFNARLRTGIAGFSPVADVG
jgi:FixJ family two-component response regulator